MKLEAAIHQFNGNQEKTKKWLDRLGLDNKILKNLYLGEFLYFTGSHLDILPNTTRSYKLAEEDI